MVHVVTQPDQVLRTTRTREVRQSIVALGTRPYLVRVVVDVLGRDIHVVTVYRTSQVAKYWRAT